MLRPTLIRVQIEIQLAISTTAPKSSEWWVGQNFPTTAEGLIRFIARLLARSFRGQKLITSANFELYDSVAIIYSTTKLLANNRTGVTHWAQYIRLWACFLYVSFRLVSVIVLLLVWWSVAVVCSRAEYNVGLLVAVILLLLFCWCDCLFCSPSSEVWLSSAASLRPSAQFFHRKTSRLM